MEMFQTYFILGYIGCVCLLNYSFVYCNCVFTCLAKNLKNNYSSFILSKQVDLYTPSQYKVFQKVTDNANAAMLNFCSPGFSDLSVRSFFVSDGIGIPFLNIGG